MTLYQYCYIWSSPFNKLATRAENRITFKRHLLLGQWTDFKIISQKYFLGWLVSCFRFNGPLRQYFSLYWAVSQREGERAEWIDQSENVQTTPTRTYCKRKRPLPYCNRNCRTPQHWKFTQHHRTTPCSLGEPLPKLLKSSCSAEHNGPELKE